MTRRNSPLKPCAVLMSLAVLSALPLAAQTVTKWSDYPALSSGVSGSDFTAIVDVSATPPATGTNKKVTMSVLRDYFLGSSATLPVANGGTGATTAGGARTNLGLVIGTDVQAFNSTLSAVAGGTYTGDDSISTLGTIGAGTWNGTTIGASYGGTGQTSLQASINALLAASGSLTQGDLFYFNGTNVVRLGAGTSGQVLTTGGTGGSPSWTSSVAVPTMDGSTSGRLLTNNGTVASWTANLSLAGFVNVDSGGLTNAIDAADNTSLNLGFEGSDEHITLLVHRTSGGDDTVWPGDIAHFSFGDNSATDDVLAIRDGKGFRFYDGIDIEEPIDTFHLDVDRPSSLTRNTTLTLPQIDGTFVTLGTVDPGADRIVFWDDSESKWSYLQAGSGISISGTTITATGGGGSSAWGGITGTLSDQTDLQSALDAKATKTPTFITQTASSDLSNEQALGSLSTGLMKNTTSTGVISIATAGTDYEVPLTFSTGLTRTTNTITVNATQNLTNLSNLTSNGFVKTTSGDGTLIVDTNTYLTTSSAASTYQPSDDDLTTIAGIADPNADRLLFWDDSAGGWALLTVGSGLSISGTTITATGGGGGSTFTDTVAYESSNASGSPLSGFSATNTNTAAADIDEFDGVNTEENVSPSYDWAAKAWNGSASATRTWKAWLKAYSGSSGTSRWHVGPSGGQGILRVYNGGTTSFVELNGASNPVTLYMGDMENEGGVNMGISYDPGTALLTFGASAMKINSSTGAVTLGHGNGVPFGYGVGAGGTVTQGTSRSQGVTVNKVCGTIVTRADSLASGASVTFTVTNSTVTANDVPQVVIQSGTDAATTEYRVTRVTSGAFDITYRNLAGSASTNALTFSFVILNSETN